MARQPFVLLCLCLASGVASAQVPLVYSRCPRSSAPFTISGMVTKGGVSSTASVTLQSGDMFEMLPDTTKQRDSFVAPCDLVYRDAAGQERILFDCISTSTPAAACAALDPAVSFDAKTIAFSVFRGPMKHIFAGVSPKDLDPAAENTATSFPTLPGYMLMSTEAQLHLVDVATGKVTPLVHEAGVFDIGPIWLANGRLGFTTDRTSTYSTMPLCRNTNPKAFQYSSMALDGRDLERPAAHALSGELHPFPLVDGRVLLSSWQLFGMLAYGHPNGVGTCGTLNNKFHLYALSPDGSHQTAVYGQHLDVPTTTETAAGLVTHMSAHFLTQSTDGRIWVDEYYRDNNLGLGVIHGFVLPPAGQEGLTVDEAAAVKGSPYRAPSQVQLARWASNADSMARVMPAPAYTAPGYADPLHYAGKVGHPAGVPGNRLLITWGKGFCSTNTGKTLIPSMRDLAALAPDNPACDTGIYLTPVLPAMDKGAVFTHPSQLTVVVDQKEFHEFFPRAVVPYQDLYGVAAPAVVADGTSTGRTEPELPAAVPFGLLGGSSIIHRETKPIGGHFLFEAPNQMSHVGTDLVDYTDDELCGIRVMAVLPNRKLEYKKKSTAPTSERLAILGEVAVRKPGAVLDGLGQPDTSFRVLLPADVPYIMQGIDCEGRSLNTDQTWQHLKPGELRTCNGCHVHSAAAGKLPFETTLAGMHQVPAAHLGEGMVPLLAGESGSDVQVKPVASWGLQIEFERDIMPIFATRCVSCHGAAKSDAGLLLDVPRTEAMRADPKTDTSTWYRLASDLAQAFVPTALRHPALQNGILAKPNLSKYVRMLNARGSQLYWKAANLRTDGRTDAKYPSAATPGVANYGQFDVDFGADHPTSITPDELRTLARWIDSGAGWGPDLTEDTIAPTLTFVGQFQSGALTSLLVGTTDVGSGIAPASLTACTIHAGGTCAPVTAGPAAMAGTVTVALSLSGLTDPDDEVEVAVKDVAGNTTTLRRTLRFLADLPPPVLAVPDGGDEGSVADGGSAGGGKGGCACSFAAVPLNVGAPLLLLALGAGLRRRGAARRRLPR